MAGVELRIPVAGGVDGHGVGSRGVLFYSRKKLASYFLKDVLSQKLQ